MTKQKKHNFLGTLFVVIIGIVFIGLVMTTCSLIKEQERAMGRECDGITQFDSTTGYTCCQDCHKLNLDYFKYEYSSGIFGAEIKNCYCLDNSKSVQIW
jgi:hypothetical protein